MLLFDQSKALEKALGEEAAKVIVHVFEAMDERQKAELATKADLHLTETLLRSELRELELRVTAEIVKVKGDIAASKLELIKWVAGLLLAQAGLIIAILRFIK